MEWLIVLLIAAVIILSISVVRAFVQIDVLRRDMDQNEKWQKERNSDHYNFRSRTEGVLKPLAEEHSQLMRTVTDIMNLDVSDRFHIHTPGQLPASISGHRSGTPVPYILTETTRKALRKNEPSTE